MIFVQGDNCLAYLPLSVESAAAYPPFQYNYGCMSQLQREYVPVRKSVCLYFLILPVVTSVLACHLAVMLCEDEELIPKHLIAALDLLCLLCFKTIVSVYAYIVSPGVHIHLRIDTPGFPCDIRDTTNICEVRNVA